MSDDKTIIGGIPTYYANILRVQRTPVDFTIIFASKVASGIASASDEGVETDHCRIVLSPVAAKLMVKHLGMTVESYEESTGSKIPVPGDIEVKKTGDLAEESD